VPSRLPVGTISSRVETANGTFMRGRGTGIAAVPTMGGSS
jgi:hypothetical protein